MMRQATHGRSGVAKGATKPLEEVRAIGAMKAHMRSKESKQTSGMQATKRGKSPARQPPAAKKLRSLGPDDTWDSCPEDNNWDYSSLEPNPAFAEVRAIYYPDKFDEEGYMAESFPMFETFEEEKAMYVDLKHGGTPIQSDMSHGSVSDSNSPRGSYAMGTSPIDINALIKSMKDSDEKEAAVRKEESDQMQAEIKQMRADNAIQAASTVKALTDLTAQGVKNTNLIVSSLAQAANTQAAAANEQAKSLSALVALLAAKLA